MGGRILPITLDELKRHLRVELDEEDTLLESLLHMTHEAALDFCKVSAFPDPIPEPVRLAILLMASHFYTHRENGNGDAYDAMLRAFHSLLWPHRDPDRLI